MFLDYVSS